MARSSSSHHSSYHSTSTKSFSSKPASYSKPKVTLTKTQTAKPVVKTTIQDTKTVAKPIAKPVTTSPVIHKEVHYVQHNSFFQDMLMYQMLFGNYNQKPVIVNTGTGQVAPFQQPVNEHPFLTGMANIFSFVIVIALIGTLGTLAYRKFVR